MEREIMKEMVTDFVEKLQVKMNAHMDEKFPNLPREYLSVNFGRRYAKLIKGYGNNRGVYCFVDMTNGDVLKAATWRAPAKHARGNLFAPDGGLGCTGPYGAAYMDTHGNLETDRFNWS